MKSVKLLTSATVNGVLRHPYEGVLHLSDEEADRLIERNAGEDVSADFSAKQINGVQEEAITASSASAPDLPSEPHQSELPAPTPDEPADPAPAEDGTKE